MDENMDRDEHTKLNMNEKGRQYTRKKMEESIETLKNCENYCVIAVGKNRTQIDMGISSEYMPYMLIGLERASKSVIKAMASSKKPIDAPIRKEDNSGQELE